MLVKEICPKCEQLSYQEGRVSKYLQYYDILYNKNMKCIPLWSAFSDIYVNVNYVLHSVLGCILKFFANLSYMQHPMFWGCIFQNNANYVFTPRFGGAFKKTMLCESCENLRYILKLC